MNCKEIIKNQTIIIYQSYFPNILCRCRKDILQLYRINNAYTKVTVLLSKV